MQRLNKVELTIDGLTIFCMQVPLPVRLQQALFMPTEIESRCINFYDACMSRIAWLGHLTNFFCTREFDTSKRRDHCHRNINTNNVIQFYGYENAFSMCRGQKKKNFKKNLLIYETLNEGEIRRYVEWQFESFKQSQFNIFTPIMASDAIYVTVVDEHYLYEALECACAQS